MRWLLLTTVHGMTQPSVEAPLESASPTATRDRIHRKSAVARWILDLRSAGGASRLGLLLQRCHQRLRGRARRMWILSRDPQAVADNVNLPIGLLREDGTQLQHLVFDKEGHHFGEDNLFLLAVGEPGDFLTLHQRLAFRCLDVTQRAGGMTYDGDCFAGGKEGLDQLDGVLVFSEIPHRTVAARVE